MPNDRKGAVIERITHPKTKQVGVLRMEKGSFIFFARLPDEDRTRENEHTREYFEAAPDRSRRARRQVVEPVQERQADECPHMANDRAISDDPLSPPQMPDPIYATVGLAAVTASGLAEREQVAQTVCREGNGFRVMPSNQYAVLREHDAADGIVPILSVLPSGAIEMHPAGRETWPARPLYSLHQPPLTAR